MARHPLTGQALEEPDPAPLRKLALYDSDKPCTDHSVAFTGNMPCTGVLQCHVCLTMWDPDTCKVICDHAITVIYAIPKMLGRWPTGGADQYRMCRCGKIRMSEAAYQKLQEDK